MLRVALRPLLRQVFWTYAAYIWFTNLCFGLVSALAPHWLLERCGGEVAPGPGSGGPLRLSRSHPSRAPSRSGGVRCRRRSPAADERSRPTLS